MTPQILDNLVEERLAKLVKRLGAELKAAKEETGQIQAKFAQQIQGERARHKCELDQIKLERDELAARLEKTEQELEWLKKQLLSGWRSEKRPDLKLNASQLWLEGFGTNVPLEDLPPPEPPKQEVKGHQRRGPRRGDKDGESRFSDEATILELEIENPLIEGIPEDELEIVQVQEIHKIVALKSKHLVVKVIQKGYRRKEGPKEEFPPPALPEVVPGSIFDVSCLVGMIIDKFRWHQPLYRQYRAMEASGIFVDRGNLTRVVQKVAILLHPIFACLKKSVLASSILAIDETPTPVCLSEKMSKGYFWVLYGELDEVLFHFATSKEGKVLDELLVDFEGHLLTDGYAAYSSFVARMEALKAVFHASCWSHTRRTFLRAEKKHPQETAFIIEMIRGLYRIEARVRGKPPAEIFQARQAESKPIVDKLFAYLEKLQAEGTFTASDPLLKAVHYALNRKGPLSEFLENPRLPLDTNHLERQLRSQAIGRKNWMFHMSETGAEHSAVFYSLIQSCLLAQVDPAVYLTDVLLRITQGEDPQLLVPRVWKQHFSDKALSSSLMPVLG